MVIIRHYSCHVVEGWCYRPCLGLFAYLFPLCFFWWIIYRQPKWQQRSLMAAVDDCCSSLWLFSFFGFLFFGDVQSRFALALCSGCVLALPAEPFHRAEEAVRLCCCNDYRVETSKEREKGTEGKVEIKWKNTVNKNMLRVPHHTYPTCTNKWKHTSSDQSGGWKCLWRSDEHSI